MKIYVASSWRNEQHPGVVARLRAEGHEVYDFKNPAPGNAGFGWRQCIDDPSALKDPRRFRNEVLTHDLAREGFALDMEALKGADATVLVLPCGRSAHLELGWATGAGQHTIVLLDDPMSEPELIYLACSSICVDMDEVVRDLRFAGCSCPNRPTSIHPPGCPKGDALEREAEREALDAMRDVVRGKRPMRDVLRTFSRLVPRNEWDPEIWNLR